MAQQPAPQYPMTQQRPFSPPLSVASPGAPQQFPFPPSKRQRLSPNPQSQPNSPYIQSPYTMSPGASGPPSATASPHFANVHLPTNVYNTPYSNGHTTPTLSLPPPQSNIQNQQSNPPSLQTQSQLNSQGYNTYAMPPQGTGMMGPPSKPAPAPKEDGFDALDILGGTGIDIREEEQYLINNSFNTQFSGANTFTPGHGFSQFPPGDEGSFYGAGPANTAAEVTNAKSQEEYHQQVADKAWYDAAHNLAVSRQRELSNPFLLTSHVIRQAHKIAQEHGLGPVAIGNFQLPERFPQSEVRSQTSVGPNSALTVTNGSFLPDNTSLADQIALISLATKYRLRGLLEDADKFARGRRLGSHGVIPMEWADVAEPAKTTLSTIVTDGAPRSGWESAVSPRSHPLKRSPDGTSKLPTPVSMDGGLKLTNEVITVLRSSASSERDFEEERLRKRQAREARASEETPRQGSVVPGTPGSIAPEVPEKPPTKKEQTKKAQAKVNEAASHAAANNTTAAFLGGGKTLFGKKKKYSWMTGVAGSGSGASTPGRIMTQGLGGLPAPGPPVPEKLTADGVRRLGGWREDQDKGKGIQIRDWVAALEADGREKRALQKAYANLDNSEPK